MKTVWITAGVILLISSLTFNLFQFVEAEQRSRQVISKEHMIFEATQRIQALEAMEADLTSRIGYSYAFSTDKLSVSLEKGISPVTDKTRKLVFRFSEDGCNVCVEQQLNKLREIAASIGSDNIVLISKFTSDRDLHLFKSKNNIEFSLYNVESLSPGLDKIRVPCYFILSRNDVSSVFLPVKEIPHMTDEYLSYIKLRYFNEAG